MDIQQEIKAYIPGFDYYHDNIQLLKAALRQMVLGTADLDHFRLLSLGVGHRYTIQGLLRELGSRLTQYLIVEGSAEIIALLRADLALHENMQLVPAHGTGPGQERQVQHRRSDGRQPEHWQRVPFEFELSTLTLHHGTLNWNDEANGPQLALSEQEMETGRLAQGADGRLHVSTRLTRAEPAWDLRVDLESAYRVAAPGSLPQLRQARLVAEGGLTGWQALHIDAALAELEWTAGGPSELQGGSVQIRGQAGGDPFDLRISTPRLKLTPRGPEADSIDASLRLYGKSRGGNVRLRLTGLQGSEKGRQASRLDADLALRLAGGHLIGPLAGPIDWQGGPGQLAYLPALAGDLAFTPARSGMEAVKFAIPSHATRERWRSSREGS